MWFVRFACAALLVAVTPGAAVAHGQAPGAAAQPPQEASAPAAQAERPDPELTPDIDREAARVLRAMAATLDKAQRFALDAEEVFDEIPDAGPRRSLTSARRIAIERRDRVVADVTGEAAWARSR
jgi:hypothetical protein